MKREDKELLLQDLCDRLPYGIKYILNINLIVMENKIVHIKLDNWNDMGDATDYLHKIEAGNCDNEVNYSAVWYDMAIIYCITTTEDYAKEHKLMEHIVEDLSTNIFGKYFPEYNPNKFGCDFEDEYEGWAPYKKFNYKK